MQKKRDMKRSKRGKRLKGNAINGWDAIHIVREMAERLEEGRAGMTRHALVARMRRVVELGMQALAAEESTESFERVAWLSVAARQGRRPATLRDLRHFVRRMLRVDGVGARPLRAMTVRDCRELLGKAFGASVHSYRKGRAILHSIFAYGRRQEWCDANPVDWIEVPEVRESPIEPLSLEETRRLLETAEMPRYREMRFSLYLMLCGGVRPGEVQRVRPERDVLWQEKLLLVRPGTSKTGGGRMVPLRAAGGIPPGECRIPGNWKRRWRELRQAAGFFHWRADTLRHTFASYHAAHFRNLAELQMEMGHRDMQLLRYRYMRPIPQRLAAAFWRMVLSG